MKYGIAFCPVAGDFIFDPNADIGQRSFGRIRALWCGQVNLVAAGFVGWHGDCGRIRSLHADQKVVLAGDRDFKRMCLALFVADPQIICVAD